MARRPVAFPTWLKLLSVAVTLASVAWIAASRSEIPTTTPTALRRAAVPPAEEIAVAAPLGARSSVPRIADAAPRSKAPRGQTNEPVVDMMNVPPVLHTFETGPAPYRAMAGMRAALDPATGRLIAPSAEQTRRMSELMWGYGPVDEDQPLVGQRLADGTELADLDQRFMEFVVVEIGPDGKLRKRCVTGPQPSVVGTAGATPGDR